METDPYQTTQRASLYCPEPRLKIKNALQIQNRVANWHQCIEPQHTIFILYAKNSAISMVLVMVEIAE